MKLVTMYEALDGNQFYTEHQCIEYEEVCENVRAANTMLAGGATVMAALNRCNQTRPGWDSNLSADDKIVLMSVTKNTKLIVEHWQCFKEPIYSPIEIDRYGRIKLWGKSDRRNASSYASSYGNFVHLSDVIRYARHTHSKLKIDDGSLCSCGHQKKVHEDGLHGCTECDKDAAYGMNSSCTAFHFSNSKTAQLQKSLSDD
jgi:hypothetical protein